MGNVASFDWKLNLERPFSYFLSSYQLRYQPTRPDMHSALHLALVISGQRSGSFAGETVTAQAGEFYLTAPWEPHYTIYTSAEHQLLLFNIDWDSLQNCFFTGRNRLEQLIMMKPISRMKILNEKLKSSSLFTQLGKLIQQPFSDNRELQIWNLIQQLFIAVLPENGQQVSASGNYQQLLPALRALSGRMMTLNEAAGLCNLSTSYFAVIFKKQFGLSFARYERNYRLNGAAAALQRGATLKEAADDWGFCDKSHLSRLLKKRS